MTLLRYMLDTNVISDIIRDPQGSVTEHVSRVGQSSLCISAIVVSELRFGVAKRGSDRLAELVEAIVSRVPVLPYDEGAAASYAAIRWDLERRGRPIGANDMLIAAHALAQGLTLVTSNTEEFSRVRDLKIENWTVKGKLQ